MSDLTICNFCRLHNIRRQTKNTDKKVSTRSGDPYKSLPNGIDVFVHPKELKGKERFQEQFKVAWFMQLTNKCVC